MARRQTKRDPRPSGVARGRKSIAAAAQRGEDRIARGEEPKRLTHRQSALVDAMLDPTVKTISEAAAIAGLHPDYASTILRKSQVETAIATRKRERLDKARSLRAVGERLLRDGLRETDTAKLSAHERVQLGGSVLKLVADVHDKLGDDSSADALDVDGIAAQTRSLVRSIMLHALRCARDRPERAASVLSRLEGRASPPTTAPVDAIALPPTTVEYD